MREALKVMEKRAYQLKLGIKKAEREKGKFPEGRLRVSVNKRQIRYYKIASGKDSSEEYEEYIPASNRALAKSLVQKEYNRAFLVLAKKELKALERSIKVVSKREADDAFLKVSEGRKKLIKPYILTDEMYAKEWEKEPYIASSFMTENKVYETIKGEKVRSKSEALIANLLYELNIPYRYEMMLELGTGETRYPDFTLLKADTREKVYLEHFGLLEYEEYREDAINKLDLYRDNGIYPGKNLLITYETSKSPLDINGIRKMLEDYFFNK